MKCSRASISLLVLLLTACSITGRSASQSASNHNDRRTLTVFAAASLTDAFKEIGADFEAAHPGVTVALNFAGSQTLRTQIEQGAQPDVFASANTTQMNALVTDGILDSTTPQVFLNNKLIVVLPANNPAGLRSLQDLARPGVKLILAAADVPVGNYSRQALDLMKTKFGNSFNEKVIANVVSNEENVKQVVAKIQLDEADAGMVYTSDAIAAPELKTIEIPSELNVVAAYPIAALPDSSNPGLAADFIAYVLSPNGQTVLHKWGFASPE